MQNAVYFMYNDYTARFWLCVLHFHKRNSSPEETCKALKPEDKHFLEVNVFISPLALREVQWLSWKHLLCSLYMETITVYVQCQYQYIAAYLLSGAGYPQKHTFNGAAERHRSMTVLK